ncbi:MAG: hypothetical protein IJA12_06075 [Oscillospiraceae bacterium]|nr:hypothetical protein [Oscillospiraceae bacterium]
MNIYTVSFFGHRKSKITSDIEHKLNKLLENIIKQNDFVEFIIGRDGEFDLFATSIIKQAIKKYSNGNTSLILILPYMRSEYRNNIKNFLNYYDEIEICSKSANAYYKSAIQIRNKDMVDRSDLVICCIQHINGGAYKTIQYAKKQNCKIINIAEE